MNSSQVFSVRQQWVINDPMPRFRAENAISKPKNSAMHWSECRRFSLPEFKRFGSFPDGFIFAGEFEEGIKQIGNCVPPLFMRAIALHIREKILSGVKA